MLEENPAPAASRPAPLQAALLRRSLSALTASRSECWHCGRTPLVGERVYLYAGVDGDRLVCELCRPLRREAPAGSLEVRSPEHRRAVRRRPRTSLAAPA